MREFKMFLQSLLPLFERFSRGSFSARDEVLEELGNRDPSKVPSFGVRLSPGFYQQHCAEIWQEFLIKIWEGKFAWKPQKGSPSVYIGTILRRQWLDLLEKKDREKARLECEGEKAIDELEQIDRQEGRTESTSLQEASIFLREIYQKKSPLLTRNQRIIFKLWMPSLFDFQWEKDEIDYLLQKKISPQKIMDQAKDAMDEAEKKGKVFLSAELIGKWIDKKRNTIDQALSRIRKILRE